MSNRIARTVQLSERDMHTVLAALAVYRDSIEGVPSDAAGILDIATNGGLVNAATSEEVTQLSEAINLGSDGTAIKLDDAASVLDNLFAFINRTDISGADFVEYATMELQRIGYVFDYDDTSIVEERLEYLRGQLRAECISYGELAELQGLASRIDPGDVELLEAAGVLEHAVTKADIVREVARQHGVLVTDLPVRPAAPGDVTGVPRALPIIEYNGSRWYEDARLSEYRDVRNPHDHFPFNSEYGMRIRNLGQYTENDPGQISFNDDAPPSDAAASNATCGRTEPK